MDIEDVSTPNWDEMLANPKLVKWFNKIEVDYREYNDESDGATRALNGGQAIITRHQSTYDFRKNNFINFIIAFLPYQRAIHYIKKLSKYGYRMNMILDRKIGEASMFRWNNMQFSHPLFVVIMFNSFVSINNHHNRILQYHEIYTTLLESGCNPNFIENGVTPLIMALINEDFAMVDILLRHGANPNLAVGIYGTALHIVCNDFVDYGHKIYGKLLEYGASPNIAINNITPYHHLMDHCYLTVPEFNEMLYHTVRIFVVAGANPWMEDSNRISVMALATDNWRILASLIWPYIKPLYVAHYKREGEISVLPLEMISYIIGFVISAPLPIVGHRYTTHFSDHF